MQYHYILHLLSLDDYTCRPGQDCPNNDIEHSSVEPDECKQKCNDDTSCVSYTTSPDGDCWLKSLCDVTKCRQNSKRTTCFKSGMCICVLQNQIQIDVFAYYVCLSSYTMR